MLNLDALFTSLKTAPSPAGSHILACPIPSFESHRLARDVQGSPLILLAVPTVRVRTRPVPIKLEHLSVQHDTKCRISGTDGVIEEGHFTVVACLEADEVLQSYFLRIMGTLIVSLGATPAQSDVTRAVYRLVELFRVLASAPTKSIQGLWAELFVIARASDAAMLVEAWHITPEDRYDFNQGSQRVEVKSGAGRTRAHQFSLEQLNPPMGTTVLISSLFVEKAGAGTSLAELLDQVRHRIGNNLDLLMQVDKVVGMTLGSSWRHAMDERFDYELARHSLAFYDTVAIPSIHPKISPEISNVSFTSDLSTSKPIDLTQYRSAGGLFQATL